jgi:cob(I)alamin adenosyltransferase
MVTLNRIYTRSGDGGRTRLATGETVSKTDARVEAYGAVDETNACVGMARLHTGADATFDAMLGRIQNELFDLGADLATPPKPDEAEGAALRILDGQVARLEGEIDALNARLPPLTSFVLPGGTPAAAALHLARTVCRRAERETVGLVEGGAPVSGPAAALSEPPLRLPVRRRPLRQRPGRGGGPLAGRRDAVGRHFGIRPSAFSASARAFGSAMTRPVMSEIRIGWAHTRWELSHHLWAFSQFCSGQIQPTCQISMATVSTANRAKKMSLRRSRVGFMRRYYPEASAPARPSPT